MVSPCEDLSLIWFCYVDQGFIFLECFFELVWFAKKNLTNKSQIDLGEEIGSIELKFSHQNEANQMSNDLSESILEKWSMARIQQSSGSLHAIGSQKIVYLSAEFMQVFFCTGSVCISK